ncbi:hypothetical protein WMY93_028471 [Mugilogobius chulae]|uniref:BED-type domain-containing protein n=1 Tax=Mugilogobius chulae TaxID=88201 RepID=A0AAW0MT21_9GOBI
MVQVLVHIHSESFGQFYVCSSSVCRPTASASAFTQNLLEPEERKDKEEHRMISPEVTSDVQISCLSPGPALKQEIPETPQIKEEPEEQSIKQEEEQLALCVPDYKAVGVKTEESSLLQQNHTEPKEEQTQGEDISTEPHFHSETEGDTEHSSDTDNDEDWRAPLSCSDQVQTRGSSRAPQNSALSSQNKSAPETQRDAGDNGHMSAAASTTEDKKYQCNVCNKTFGCKRGCVPCLDVELMQSSVSSVLTPESAGTVEREDRGRAQNELYQRCPISCVSPGPDLKQEISETPQIKEEPEEQSIKQEEEQLTLCVPDYKAVGVKTDESSLLQQNHTELKEEQTQGEDISTEPHFHSETEGDTEHSSDTDNDEDWRAPLSCSDQVQTRGSSTAPQNSALSSQNKSAPETQRDAGDNGHMSAAASTTEDKKYQCNVCNKTFGCKRESERCPDEGLMQSSVSSVLTPESAGTCGEKGQRKSVQISCVSPGPALKQEIPETPQIKEEPEEQSIKQEEEQLTFGKKRSMAWDHFDLLPSNKVRCMLCTQVLSYTNNTSSMLRHLRARHSTDQSQQSTTGPCNSCQYPDISKKQLLDEAIVDMIIKDGQPFSMVEGEGFTNLMEILDPLYKVPCRKTVKTMVEERYQQNKKKAEEDLKKASAVSLTADMWTSRNMDAYLGVTCHYLSDDLDLSTVLLGVQYFPMTHTAAHIAEAASQ